MWALPTDRKLQVSSQFNSHKIKPMAVMAWNSSHEKKGIFFVLQTVFCAQYAQTHFQSCLLCLDFTGQKQLLHYFLVQYVYLMYLEKGCAKNRSKILSCSMINLVLIWCNQYCNQYCMSLWCSFLWLLVRICNFELLQMSAEVTRETWTRLQWTP